MLKTYDIPSRRQGKSLSQELMLAAKLRAIVTKDIPSKLFVLIRRNEQITWLPTGEVISRRI